jgi:aryl-alcohol dehydrogenase-like predicted oxidoreductase
VPAIADQDVFDPEEKPQPILGLAGLGSLRWSGSRRSRSQLAILDQAYEDGFRVMDTAAIYGLGASEKGLGRWMRLRLNRDKVFVITKGGHPSLLRPGRHRLTVEGIAHDLQASLQRLQTEYVDLYLLHRDAAECDVTGLLQFLDDQKRRGVVRALGVSNWHHARIEAANAIARRRGLTELSVSSPQLSLLAWSRPPWRGCVSVSGAAGAAARSWYRDARMPVLAWSPFGGGLRETGAGEWSPAGRCYRHPSNQQRLAGAAAVARERDLSIHQVLIAYLASLPCLVHPIYATRSLQHLRANRDALAVRLAPEELRRLEAEPLGAAVP